MNVGIIGSGISGLSIANMLRDQHKVIVMEQQNKPGGLIKCERVNDCLFHKIGGHVFNSRNETVLDWFWSYFNKETEFVKAPRNAKIFFDNKIIGYPIENYIYLLGRFAEWEYYNMDKAIEGAFTVRDKIISDNI
jgi:UDP-galactopyranose mutase